MDNMVYLNGALVPFSACVSLMDDDICADLHNDIAPCSDQEFLDAYIERHASKFGGEQFCI